jgi:hypothetical protein
MNFVKIDFKFLGSMYWRFDEGIQHVELDYPRDLSMWKGVPENFDAVFQVTKPNLNLNNPHHFS